MMLGWSSIGMRIRSSVMVEILVVFGLDYSFCLWFGYL